MMDFTKLNIEFANMQNTITKYNNIQNEITDVPKQKFITAAESWKNIRSGTLPKNMELRDSSGYKGLKASWLQLMNDFNCLMNNEKSFLF